MRTRRLEFIAGCGGWNRALVSRAVRVGLLGSVESLSRVSACGLGICQEFAAAARPRRPGLFYKQCVSSLTQIVVSQPQTDRVGPSCPPGRVAAYSSDTEASPLTRASASLSLPGGPPVPRLVSTPPTDRSRALGAVSMNQSQ